MWLPHWFSDLKKKKKNKWPNRVFFSWNRLPTKLSFLLLLKGKMACLHSLLELPKSGWVHSFSIFIFLIFSFDHLLLLPEAVQINRGGHGIDKMNPSKAQSYLFSFCLIFNSISVGFFGWERGGRRRVYFSGEASRQDCGSIFLRLLGSR